MRGFLIVSVLAAIGVAAVLAAPGKQPPPLPVQYSFALRENMTTGGQVSQLVGRVYMDYTQQRARYDLDLYAQSMTYFIDFGHDTAFLLSFDETNTPVCESINYTWPILPRAAIESATYVGMTYVYGSWCETYYIGQFDHLPLNITLYYQYETMDFVGQHQELNGIVVDAQIFDFQAEVPPSQYFAPPQMCSE